MHFSHAALVSLLTLAPIALAAQSPQQPSTPASAPQATPQAAPAAPPATSTTPGAIYAILQPALADVQNSLSGIKTDKWKRGSVRDEAADNIKAILHDLQENLPPLVTTADASPSAVSPSVPLVKHLGAIYDVLLRVEEAARVSAPGDQVAQLQQTLKSFETARLAVDDHIQQSATDQEKKITELQAALTKAQSEAAAAAQKPAPAAEPCKPPAPIKKKRKPAPAAKPAQPAGQQQPAPKPQ